jgi:hypothetical protein
MTYGCIHETIEPEADEVILVTSTAPLVADASELANNLKNIASFESELP